jgi:hypothetical protein
MKSLEEEITAELEARRLRREQKDAQEAALERARNERRDYCAEKIRGFLYEEVHGKFGLSVVFPEDTAIAKILVSGKEFSVHLDYETRIWKGSDESPEEEKQVLHASFGQEFGKVFGVDEGWFSASVETLVADFRKRLKDWIVESVEAGMLRK